MHKEQRKGLNIKSILAGAIIAASLVFSIILISITPNQVALAQETTNNAQSVSLVSAQYCNKAQNTKSATELPQPSITVYPKTVPYNAQGQGFTPEDINVILENEAISDYVVYYENSNYNKTTELPIKADIYTATIVTSGNGHTQATAETTFTISKINPKLTFEGKLTEQYGAFKPIIARANGLYGEQGMVATVEYSFGSNPRPSVGTHKVYAIFDGNDNYNAHKESVDYVVTPRQIAIEVSGSIDAVYSGLSTTRNVSRKGVLGEDAESFVLTTTYNGALSAIDVGNYTMEFAINNNNYTIGTISGGRELIIRAKELVVSTNKVVVKQGETPIFKYSYSGFVVNEDERVITVPPTVANLPTEFGEYTVTPSGAKAKNYKFIYNSTKLIINTASLSAIIADTDYNLQIEGSFSPNAILQASMIAVSDESGIQVFNKLKTHKQVYSKGDITAIYNISLQNGISDDEYIKIKLNNVKLSKLFQNRIGIIDTKGDFRRISKFQVNKDGVAEFYATDVGQVVIYKNTIPTYIMIGIGGLIVVAIIVYIILSAVVYNKKKKYGNKEVIPFNEEKYVKEEKKYKW